MLGVAGQEPKASGHSPPGLPLLGPCEPDITDLGDEHRGPPGHASILPSKASRRREAMLKKMLRSIGVGNADVDTQLNGDTFMPGGLVTGTVLLRGGKGAQEFGRIYLSVVTWYKHDDTTHKYALVKGEVSGPFVLQPGEQRMSAGQLPAATRHALRSDGSVGWQCGQGWTCPAASTRATATPSRSCPIRQAGGAGGVQSPRLPPARGGERVQPAAGRASPVRSGV